MGIHVKRQGASQRMPEPFLNGFEWNAVIVRGTVRQENGQSVKVVAKEVKELVDSEHCLMKPSVYEVGPCIVNC